MPVPERSGRIRRLWAVILFTLLAAGGPAASAAEATSVAAVLINRAIGHRIRKRHT